MKHNLFKLYKGIFSIALAVLLSQPLLAQSGSGTSAPSVKPAPKAHVKFDRKFIESDIRVNLKKLDLQLANLDHTLSGLEVKLAPKIALFERNMERAFANVAEDFEIHVQPHFSQPNVDPNYVQAAEKTKTMTKSYSVDGNDKLAINNQYGKVVVNTWPKKEIKVDIEIKSYEGSESKAQEQLDGVSISESRQGDLISFKTNIDKKNIRKKDAAYK
jgi:hypothetical protein